MHSHPNSRLTQKSRLRLINKHLQDRRPLAELAAEAGISLRCAYKWLARFRSGGAASLADRRSVRRTQSRPLDPQQQQQATAIGFLCRAVAWFNSQGVECRQVMSDNGPAYLSRSFAKACKALGLKHIRTRPYTLRTNGKAERLIHTLCKESAYAMAFPNSQERDHWLPHSPSIHNRIRKVSALCGRSPQQRLHELLR
jgi:transposase InsO family protein